MNNIQLRKEQAKQLITNLILENDLNQAWRELNIHIPVAENVRTEFKLVYGYDLFTKQEVADLKAAIHEVELLQIIKEAEELNLI